MSVSASGSSHSTLVVAIDLDGLGLASDVGVTKVDVEQAGCIITHVIIILGLGFQLVIRVRR
jgi:hypothetical protein